MPFAGQTVPLSLQLYDGATNKFPRAIVLDENGTAISGSPFDLTHIGNGKYSNDSLPMPSTVAYLEVTYEVFSSSANRAAGTPLDPNYTTATDVFPLEIPDTVIVSKLDQIIAKLTGLALPGAAIEAKLVQNIISEAVEDLKETKALVQRDETAVKVVTQNVSNAKIDKKEISAKTNC